MKHLPLIKSVMTPFPYSIDINASMGDAERMMLQHTISHLPVKENGQLVSVITERDIRLARQQGREGLGVRDVCVRGAYIVDLTERLDSVLLHMARAHIDSALVVKHGKLAGIFTTTDACRCYGEYLRSLFPTGGGTDAA
jgi:acetoin utilization protein AcuB